MRPILRTNPRGILFGANAQHIEALNFISGGVARLHLGGGQETLARA